MPCISGTLGVGPSGPAAGTPRAGHRRVSTRTAEATSGCTAAAATSTPPCTPGPAIMSAPPKHISIAMHRVTPGTMPRVSEYSLGAARQHMGQQQIREGLTSVSSLSGRSAPYQFAAEAWLRGAALVARLTAVAATEIVAAQNRRVQQRLQGANEQDVFGSHPMSVSFMP